MVSRFGLVDENMEKPDFDPKKVPPQPSLRKVIKMVILAHLMIIGWVALMWVSDGEIMKPPGSRNWDWLDNLLDGL